MDNSSLRFSIAHTLVDISKTNEVSDQADIKLRNQQRNWETIIQTIGLRAQVVSVSEPVMVEIDANKTRFGSDFAGNHKMWSFTFGVEQDSVFANTNSSHGTLASDFTNVPIISGLNETAELSSSTFIPTGPKCNIYFDSFMT